MVIHYDSLLVKFVGQSHRFRVTGGKIFTVGKRFMTLVYLHGVIQTVMGILDCSARASQMVQQAAQCHKKFSFFPH